MEQDKKEMSAEEIAGKVLFFCVLTIVTIVLASEYK